MDTVELKTGDPVFLHIGGGRHLIPSTFVRGSVARTTKTQVVVSYRAYGRDFEEKFSKDGLRGIGGSRFNKVEPFEAEKHNPILHDQMVKAWWSSFVGKSHDIETLRFLYASVRERETSGEFS